VCGSVGASHRQSCSARSSCLGGCSLAVICASSSNNFRRRPRGPVESGVGMSPSQWLCSGWMHPLRLMLSPPSACTGDHALPLQITPQKGSPAPCLPHQGEDAEGCGLSARERGCAPSCPVPTPLFFVLPGITESQNSRGWKGPLWVI